jgi:CheY-like chemotaxis protein
MEGESGHGSAGRRNAGGGRVKPEEPRVSCPACGHEFVAGAAPPPARPLPIPSAAPTVLVVEDSPYFRELIREALAGGYRTVMASTKEAALAHLRQGGVHLVLLDLSLEGGVDGREVLREMGTKTCPILVFTARDEAELYSGSWAELTALGADDILLKGLNVRDQLVLKVEQLLGGRR